MSSTTTPNTSTSLDNQSFGIRAVVVALIGGFSSGLLGLGGGVVMVPLVVMVLAYSQRFAQMTSLAAIVPISFVALVIYGPAGYIQPIIALLLISGSLIGSRFGVALLIRLPERALKILFGVLLLATAVLMFV